MKNNKLYKDFDNIISYKTKFRDLQISKENLNTKYIEFLTREINFLISMFALLKLNDEKSELEAIKQRAISFDLGQKFGVLVERFKDTEPRILNLSNKLPLPKYSH
jgi:hypothetical protein